MYAVSTIVAEGHTDLEPRKGLKQVEHDEEMRRYRTPSKSFSSTPIPSCITMYNRNRQILCIKFTAYPDRRHTLVTALFHRNKLVTKARGIHIVSCSILQLTSS